jgi:hypothetical protein
MPSVRGRLLLVADMPVRQGVWRGGAVVIMILPGQS